MYLVNPSAGLKLFFSLIARFIDPITKSKIKLVDRDSYQLMTFHISSDQLEKKYGGKMEDATNYWPIFTTLDEEPYTITREMRRREEEKRNHTDSRDFS